MEIVLFLLLLVLAVLHVRLWRRYRRTVRKVSFLFNALDNGDYTFRFSAERQDGNDRLLNQSLDRVKEILQHARDEQMEREKYYEIILNSVDTGILVIDDERDLVLRTNQAALHLLRRPAVSHISQIKDLLGGFSLRESHAVLRGKRVRIIGFSDIRGELANQEIDSWVKLIRVLTHEIMNSVTPIISLSDTLLRQTEGEEHEGMQVINQTGKELMAFVENYRRFTHVPVPVPRLFYVAPFLERMVSLSRPNVAEGCTLSTAVEPQDLLVYADEGLIGRVVINLLKNAAEATGAGNHIWLRAYSNPQDQVVIDVCNDGPMISDEVAAHIFVPFFTTKPEGSGIGLPLSRQIMRVSNGSLTLVSDRRQGVTIFRLMFR